MNNEMDSLIGVETSPVELSEIVGTDLPSVTLPKAAMRNRAATTALLSDNPDNAVNEFQLMMAEGEQGQDNLVKVSQERILSKAEASDKEAFMSVLSDPSIPMDRKQSIIRNMANNPVRKDVGTKLLTDNLEKPSAGESIEAEDARINATSRAIGQIYEAREQIQGLVNAHAASLQNESALRTTAEITSAWVLPFSQNVLMATLTQNKPGATIWDAVKALALPGTAKEKMYNELKNLPPEQRVQATKDFIDLISQNSQTLFANNNQFAQFQLATEAFNEGGYSSVDKWLDNLGTVLDLVGLGAVARTPKGVEQMVKGVVAADTSGAVVGASKALPVAGQAGELTKITGKPTVGVFDDKIRQLESQKADLIGEAGNILDKGQVDALRTERKQIESLFRSKGDINSLAKDIQRDENITSKAAKEKAKSLFSETRADYEAQLSRIDSQLEVNRNASTVTQRVAELEKQIETLKSRNTEVFIKKNPLAEAIERIERNPVHVPNPASPVEIMKLANPQRARDMHTLFVNSADDVIAEGLAGTNRVQAISNNVYPQVLTESGKVSAQVVDIDRNLRREMQVPNSIHSAIWKDGGIMYTPQEKAAIKANVVRDFQAAEGLVMRESMGGFKDEGIRLNISAVYGTPEGDFKNAKQAFDQAKYALRKYGVLDEEIQVLSKEGLDYVPVKLADVGDAEGSYVVRVNTFHEVDPTDVAKFEGTSVKLNWLDRLPVTQWGQHGSLNRYLLDASSMLDPKYTGAASVASDRAAGFEKLMLEVATEYSDSYKSLSKTEQQLVDNYHREANFNQLAFDAGDLRARGFSPQAIDAVKKWRNFWDGHFYLENLDLVRTMNGQGYMKFSNANADLYAKPSAKNSTIGKVYDPATDTVVILSQKELDDLYAKGGSYAKLRRPTDFGGTTVEHMIVRNTPTEFLRKFRDTDQVLNYREGYYQLQYTAPRFVDEISVGANGQTVRRAVAVAGDTAEAQHFVDRMKASAPSGVQYSIRGDERALRRGSDDWFDINSSSGRIAQRHRGKLLEDGAGLNHLGDGSYILDPVTSAIRAAKSIAGRTVNRPMLEAAKARFMQQHGSLLPGDGIGGVRFPNNVSEIGAKGEATSKRVADARSDFNYIHYLENGYINGIDSAWKQFFNAMAAQAGKKGLSKLERGATALSETAPAQLSKQSVFMATIGSNPLRQWLIQPHQAARMMAYNPQGVLTGKVAAYSTAFLERKIADKLNYNPLLTNKASEDFIKFVEDSGMMAAVDKQNLVRGSLMDAAESSSRIGKMAKAPVNFLRKIGFDIGEMANTLGHLAAVYDKYVSQGKNLADPAVRTEAYSVTRAISYDMNFAGDMPYNQTTPSLLLQFMQVPHKAALQILNRRIPLQDRAMLAAGDILFWGPPTLLISQMMGGDILPDDPKMREAVIYGIEGLMINEALQSLFDDETINVDFSSLAPYDMHGISKVLYTFFTEGPVQSIANSPAGQLFTKDNGRIPNAVASALRFFGAADPIGETPDSFLRTMNEVMKISSGWSNATKAYIALETGKRQDNYGRPVADSVHNTEAVMLAFGFGNAAQRDLWKVIEQSNKVTKSFKEDVMKDYKTILQYYETELGKGIQDPEQLTAVTSFVLKRYADNPEAVKIIREQLKFDLADPNSKLLYQIMKASGLPEGDKLKDSIRMSALPDDQKQLILDRIDDIARLRNKGN